MTPFVNDHPVAASVLYAARPAKAAPLTPTVVIVDQDAAVRDALSITLCASGFRVLLFESGSQLLSKRPLPERGCLLVEFDLKDIKGTDLIARLFAEQIELPAVIMSARLRWPFLNERLPSGIVTILQKPFGRDELLESLRLALGT
jgi:FixJ family two-component response regulator